MDDFFNKAKVFLGFDSEPYQVEKRKVAPAKGNNLIKLNTLRQGAQNEVRVIEPRVYEDSISISTFLREQKPVIVNLKYIDNSNGKRLIDFVCGTAYAINGHMLKIGENIFLFTPENINITEGDEETGYTQTQIQEPQVLRSAAG